MNQNYYSEGYCYSNGYQCHNINEFLNNNMTSWQNIKAFLNKVISVLKIAVGAFGLISTIISLFA